MIARSNVLVSSAKVRSRLFHHSLSTCDSRIVIIISSLPFALRQSALRPVSIHSTACGGISCDTLRL